MTIAYPATMIGQFAPRGVIAGGALVSFALAVAIGVVWRPYEGIGGPRQEFRPFDWAHRMVDPAPSRSWYGPVWKPVPWTSEPDYSTYDSLAQTAEAVDVSATVPSDDAEALADSLGQVSQVRLIDDQGRGQIDDLAHRAEPAAQISEPGAERARIDRSGEFDNADRAQDADVSYPRQVAARLQPAFQRGRDDFRPRVNLASEDERPEPPGVVDEVVGIFLVEAGPEQIHRHLQLVDEFRLRGMPGLAADHAKGLQVFLLQPVQLPDEDVNRVREDERAVAEVERLRARCPVWRSPKVQTRADLDVGPALLIAQAGGFDDGF